MASIEPPQSKGKIETTTPFLENQIVAYEYSSDDDVDPVIENEYYRQLQESGGFDLTIYISTGSHYPHVFTNESHHLHDIFGTYARVGLHWYNYRKGLDLRAVRIVKFNFCFRSLGAYYVTMEVMDPANNSHLTFQTCVTRHIELRNNEEIRIIIGTCRIKGEDDEWVWNEEPIDDLYNRELEWFSDDVGDKQKQYYEVQESEIQKNDWLNLYTEYAFQAVQESQLTKFIYYVPLKIKKVVVQTCEDVESSKKLKSENAIFYISFSDRNQTENHRAIVRRVRDSKGSVSLEVKVEFGDLSIK